MYGKVCRERLAGLPSTIAISMFSLMSIVRKERIAHSLNLVNTASRTSPTVPQCARAFSRQIRNKVREGRSARRHESSTTSEPSCAEKPACSAPWLALKCSACSPSRQCNFSSSRRHMDRSPRFLHQMAHGLLRLIHPYLPHNNLRLRREVAYTRAHPADCPERTHRHIARSLLS